MNSTNDRPFNPGVLGRKGPNWPLLVIVILVVAVGLGYAGYQILAPESGSALSPPGEEDPVASAAGKGAAAMSGLDMAAPPEMVMRWRDEHLKGTPYAGLEVKPLDESYGLAFVAGDGDTIPTVASSYLAAAGFPEEERADLADRIAARHEEAYGRDLQPGDELLLPVPDEAAVPDIGPSAGPEEVEAEGGTEG